MKHFDLSGKRAVVLGSTPPATVMAEAYEEAGASVFKIESVSSITEPIDIFAVATDTFEAKPIQNVSDEDLNQLLNDNFIIPFQAIRKASQLMGPDSRMVIVTHVLGERGLPNCSAYAASHGAIHNLIRASAQEFAPMGISINGISLGWMEWMADRIDKTDPEANRAIRFTILKREGQAKEIGPLAVWVSGSAAGFVTGQIYPVDGGLTQHL